MSRWEKIKKLLNTIEVAYKKYESTFDPSAAW